MRFELHMDCNNTAFVNSTPADQTAAILRHVADRLEAGRTEAKVYDANGNAVGMFALIEPFQERTDHSRYIRELREQAEAATPPDSYRLGLVADLLEAHDDTGISLDNWLNAREFVEYHISATIDKNGA